jgi:hypothetical protein
MLQLAETIANHLGKSENELRELTGIPALYLRRKVAFLPWREELLAVADYRQLLPAELQGEFIPLADGCCAMRCPADSGNIALLQSVIEPLQPVYPRGKLCYNSFNGSKMPLFRVECQAEMEKTILTVFRRGWQNGFAVCSATMNGGTILPLLEPLVSENQPEERQTREYANHTFVLNSSTLSFSAETLSCCTRRYNGLLHYLVNSRKQNVLLMPSDVQPQELLFLARELWLAKGRMPLVILPQGVDQKAFEEVNNIYGQTELLP